MTSCSRGPRAIRAVLVAAALIASHGLVSAQDIAWDRLAEGLEVAVWTPGEAQGPGDYAFAVRVTDGAVNSDSPVTLHVTEVNAAPLLTGVPSEAAIPEMQAYTFAAHATDVDLPALKAAGVAGIFQPGTAMDDIVRFIREHGKPRSIPAGT